MKKNASHIPLNGYPGNVYPEPHHEVITFQFEHFSKCDHLDHQVYTRHGGFSEPPYNTLNVGYNTGDRPENIRANLQVIMDSIGAGQLVFLNQLHGENIWVLHRENFRDLKGTIDGDAMITDVANLALMVTLADCQAVMLFDPVKRVVSNIHCGWRGNAAGIIGSVVSRMVSDFASKPSNMLAAIGPSLGPCCAEFLTHRQIFPRVFDRFMVRRNYFDLWEISRWQLLEAGLKKENIEIAGMCTRCRTDLFYSYRGEGTTGRFATTLMLK